MTKEARKRLSRLYITMVSVVGAVLLVSSVHTLADGEFGYRWLVLAILTWATGSFAVKVPAIPATIYVSETFVFAMVLLFGGAPAAFTLAVDGLLISLRRKNREAWRIAFNVAEPACSVSVAAWLFFLTSGVRPLALAPSPLGRLLLPAILMGGVYFLLNSWLTALALASETGTPPQRLWRSHFMWLGLNSIGGASLGLILAVTAPGLDLTGLVVIVPLLLISYLTFKTSMARVEDTNRHLSELNTLYLSTVETLAMAIDAKDEVTHGHIRRVQTYAIALARAVGVDEDKDIKAVEAAALLHDVGKIAVPEFILNKPGKLTKAEYERMKLHAPVGADILSQIDFPYPVVPIVRHHHENWDGTGYPDGLKGVDIPVGARIMSVVDCYDALTSDRPYRPALSSDEAFGILTERKGTMYDPRVVDAFTRVYNEINLGESQSHDRQESLVHLIKTPLPPSDEEKAEGPAAGSSNAADEILLLSELAGGLAGHVPLDDVAEIISRHLKRVLPAPLVVLYLQEEASGDLVAAHGSGFGENLLVGLRIPLGHGLSGWVAANRTTIVNARPSLDLGDRFRALSPPLESALSTPLVTDGGLVGVLTLYAATDHAFSDDHRQVIELVARQIAASVLRARSFEHDRALMLRDELTGLPNARLLVQLLASQGLAESNLLLSCGVLCFAVEPGLTAVGSEDGNELLVRVAAAIRKALRSSDFVFRYSARELVMLMPDSSPPVTRRIARRIFASVLADAPRSYDGAIQVGLAFAPIDGSSVEELLQAARRRMGTYGDLAEVEVDGTLARVGSGVARS